MTGLLEFSPDEKEFVDDYNAAWEIVARQLVMDKAQLRDIQQHMRPIFNQGITKIYKQLEPIFNRTAWQWPNLDKHIALFRTYPEMPYMLDWAAADVKVTKRSIPEARHRAEILMHYVCFLCRAQRRNREIKAAISRNPNGVAIFSDAGDPGEQTYYASIDSVDDSHYPPFFPGDRTTLMWLRTRDQVPPGRKVIEIRWKGDASSQKSTKPQGKRKKKGFIQWLGK